MEIVSYMLAVVVAIPLSVTAGLMFTTLLMLSFSNVLDRADSRKERENNETLP